MTPTVGLAGSAYYLLDVDAPSEPARTLVGNRWMDVPFSVADVLHDHIDLAEPLYAQLLLKAVPPPQRCAPCASAN